MKSRESRPLLRNSPSLRKSPELRRDRSQLLTSLMSPEKESETRSTPSPSQSPKKVLDRSRDSTTTSRTVRDRSPDTLSTLLTPVMVSTPDLKTRESASTVLETPMSTTILLTTLDTSRLLSTDQMLVQSSDTPDHTQVPTGKRASTSHLRMISLSALVMLPLMIFSSLLTPPMTFALSMILSSTESLSQGLRLLMSHSHTLFRRRELELDRSHTPSLSRLSRKASLLKSTRSSRRSRELEPAKFRLSLPIKSHELSLAR